MTPSPLRPMRILSLLPLTILLASLSFSFSLSLSLSVSAAAVDSSTSFSSSEVDHGAPIIQIQHLPPGHPFRPPTHRQPDEQTITIEEQQPIVVPVVVPVVPVVTIPQVEVTPPKIQVPVVVPSVPSVPVYVPPKQPTRPVIPTPTVTPSLPPVKQEVPVEPPVSVPVHPVVPPAAVVTPASTPTPSQGLCPAITWTHKYECSSSEGKCLLSFINTSPNLPVDWVDIHLVSNSLDANKLVSGSSISVPPASSSSASFPSVKLDYRMHLMAGAKGLMHAMHAKEGLDQVDPMPLPLSSALAQSLLRESNAVQVFQLAIPIGFNKGEQLEARFTYCANGVDCDTEWVKLIEAAAPAAPVQSAVKKPSLSQECPAIEFTPDVHCESRSRSQSASLSSDASSPSSSSSSPSRQCFVSFVNLTPNRPLDWVDLHFSSNAPMALEAIGIATGSTGSGSMTNPDPIKLNFRMKHSAGMVGVMKMEMDKGMEKEMEMGAETMHEPMSMPMPTSMPMEHAMSPLGASLLERHSASQVFQFPLPSEFLHGSNVKASFTYCANGLDCDTNEFKLDIEKPC